jgi:hypothetical protein
MLQNLSDDARTCYLRAQDCAEKAKNAATPQLRSDFLRLEQAWLTLARSYEFSSRLSAFHSLATHHGRSETTPLRAFSTAH